MVRRCFAWKIPSNDRCMSAVRLSSISHFKMEKLDSTDVVFARIVTSPPQNERKCSNWPSTQSHASLNVVMSLCLSIMPRRTMSEAYNFKSSRCSISICSTPISDQDEEMCCRNGSSPSFRKAPWCSLTSWARRTGDTFLSDARWLLSRLALTNYRRATSAIAYMAMYLITSCWSPSSRHS